MRRGAASCRAVPRSCPVTAAAGVVTAEPSWIAQRRRRCNPSEVRAAQPAVAVVVAVQDVRTPATAVVAGPRPLSAMRTDVRPTGRADVWCPGDRCPRDRGDPGCPDGRVGCPQPLQPRCPDRAGSRNPSVRRDRPHWRTGLDVSLWSVRGLGRRCPNRAWRQGMVERWPCVARTRVDARPGLPLGMRTGCGAALAARPPWELVQRRCRSVAGEQGKERVLQVLPQVRPGQVAGVLADHGAGSGGGDHAAWSGRWCWSPIVPRWRPYPAQRGVGCGRSAAAVCQERCPLRN
jgi:hypothetical protein